MEIKYKKLVSIAFNPYRMHDVDAGFDLFAVSRVLGEGYNEYNTGLAFEIPEGYVGLIFPRSSITKKDLILKNSVGVVDASYRGAVTFRFYNLDAPKHTIYGEPIDPFTITNRIYDAGERIGQIVFMEIPKITLIEADQLSDTERGINGYGSTGSK